ncbi:Uncharacterized membrane protein [Acetitomaculum ruminis DSM 5522]|uniref:Uncharacterized membrane protein n=1 Tax=Acetitomaculum ruminis DSM 5522 TaxID=1120918 RepID=A0A1I0WWB9_9FIRM|nr:ECF transporter S component [Acetitomaculum ruminis]SFA92458.1 Uncharacterized membrane protein [Acetitomaculum ruminis DSM 5522]
MRNENLRTLTIAALLTALTTLSTMVIKFPTVTFGYIHLGDGFVLLSGIILGPFYGGLAAGIGSMFADLFSGYAIFAPGTFIIKAAAASIIGFVFHKFKNDFSISSNRNKKVIFGGILAESAMVLGYVLYETLLNVITTASYTSQSIFKGFLLASTGIPFNIVQGITGITICFFMLPVLLKIESAKKLIIK